MGIRVNPDGSITVGILDEVKGEKKSAPVQEQTTKKPARKRPSAG